MIDQRAFSKSKLEAVEPLPYVSRKALKRVKHPSPKIHECDYCGGDVKIANNKEVYGRSYGKWPYVYLCECCNSYVGIHPDTDIPLGTLADSALREKRRRSKGVFMGWVKRSGLSLNSAYAVLAEGIGIEVPACHFGMFNEDQCVLAENWIKGN